MDFKGFFENLKEKIISLYELIRDYCSENKRNAILIGSLLVLILILLILLICVLMVREVGAVASASSTMAL